MDVNINDLLRFTVEKKASDLHLAVGLRPSIRLYGEIKPLEDFPPLSKEAAAQLIYSMITQEQREEFEKEWELDFSYKIEGLCRFRANLYRQLDGIGIAIRVIPFKIPTPEELNLTPEVIRLTELNNGLVLVVGSTGNGKSTTLAALINKINQTEPRHIITIEDPVEFIYPHARAMVTQRQVGTHTSSFTRALKYALREDPDVILVGEMRDLETISAALGIAETGHLVFATLHTPDALQTVDRIIDVFPPYQQQQIRTMLAGVLKGVICQQLLTLKDGNGRTAAREVLIVTPAVANLIRKGHTHQLYSIIQTGTNMGMMTMDSDVRRLAQQGIISKETAARAIFRPATSSQL